MHVEYIHLGVCLSFIQDILTEAILSHPRLHLSRKVALVKALGKVIWIQNDLFAKWHVRDGAEFVKDEEVVIEEEGFLHGKKILSEDDGEDGDAPSTPSKPGICPFSEIAKGLGGLKVAEGLKVEELKVEGLKVAEDGSEQNA